MLRFYKGLLVFFVIALILSFMYIGWSVQNERSLHQSIFRNKATNQIFFMAIEHYIDTIRVQQAQSTLNLLNHSKYYTYYSIRNTTLSIQVNRYSHCQNQHSYNEKGIVKQFIFDPNQTCLSVKLEEGYWMNASIQYSKRYLFNHYWWPFAIVMALVALIVICILLYRRRLVINSISEGLRRIGASNAKDSCSYVSALELLKDSYHFIEMMIQTRQTALAYFMHDMKTPLQKILFSTRQTTAETAEFIACQVKEIDGMVYEFLQAFQFSIAAEKSTKLDLYTYLALIIDEYPKSSLHITLQCQDPFISYDAQIFKIKFKRVIDNLLSNAVRYASQVSIELCTEDRYHHVTIRDNGPGLSDEQLARANSGGSHLTIDGKLSLGLEICQEIIHKMGGRIYFNHDTDIGLRIDILLPNAD